MVQTQGTEAMTFLWVPAIYRAGPDASVCPREPRFLWGQPLSFALGNSPPSSCLEVWFL